MRSHVPFFSAVLVATVKGSEEVFQNNIIKAPNTRDPDNPYAMVPVERKFKFRIHRFFKLTPEIRPRALYII